MDIRPEEVTEENIDEKLINYADLRRFGENINRHYASVGVLKAKANITEVYTRREIDDKLADISVGEGVKGDKGDTGEQGPKGDPGQDGQDGRDGTDGKSAFEIAKENGFTGSEAEWLESLQGTPGINGVSGQDGESAYEIAVRNGFNGTEKEWLESLKGKDGTATDPIDTTNFVQKNELEGYATKEDIPNVAELAKKSDIPDVTELAKKSDIPDVSNLAKKSDIPDVSNLATKDDIPDVSALATKDDIPDLTGYAKAEDIPKQKTLAELGGVTQTGVEAIIQAKDFVSTDVVKKMIEAAIAEALKNNGGNSGSGDNGGGDSGSGSGGDTPEPEPNPPTPIDESDYAWTHYFVVPAGVSLITDHVSTFFGEPLTPEDFFGPDYDMKNATTEIRVLGTLRDNENTATAVDDDIKGRTIGYDFTEYYKEGLRVPFDAAEGVDLKAYLDELDRICHWHNGAINYDGEEAMLTTRWTAGCGLLYLVRKLKDGKTFPEYTIGEKLK